MDPTELLVGEAAQSLRAGDITAESYAEALLARADANRDLNAFITLDRQSVLAAAHEAAAAPACTWYRPERATSVRMVMARSTSPPGASMPTAPP